MSTTDELIADTEELLKTLKSVRDAASAQAATQPLKEQYGRVYALSDKWVSSAKSSDRSGGVSKQGFDKIKAQMTKYGSLLGTDREAKSHASKNCAAFHSSSGTSSEAKPSRRCNYG